MSHIVYGSRYQRGLSTTEIAKLIRLEIKQAIKEGVLPKGKYSVRSRYYAGGSSIDIRIQSLSVPVISAQWALIEAVSNVADYAADKLTDEAKRVRRFLGELVDAYNFDGSDLYSDYFHVNFYSSVDFDWEMIENESKRIRESFQQLSLLKAA